jgi:hypothetical protein
MFLRNEYAEPRQGIRFKALDGTFVSFGSQSDQGLCFIIEISSGGLSFEYIPIGETFKNISEIDIISNDNNFRIEKVPCKKIYELALEDENYTPVQMYQVGVQFGEIESKQIDNLVHFIRDLNDYL